MIDPNLNTEGMLTAIQLAGILNVGVERISAWYKWYNDDNFKKPNDLPELPEYYRKHPTSKRYWKKEDVKKIKKFQEALGRGRAGVMGEFNARFWQERGKNSLENKGRSDLIEEYFKK